MEEHTRYPEIITSRFRLLMLARVMIVTLLLGMVIFVEVMGMESLSSISVSMLFNTIILTYILSILFLVLPKLIPNLRANIYIQSVCDIALVTIMVFATGGIRSIYSVLYPLIVIYSVIFLTKRGGFVIATIAGISYGLFGILEINGILHPLYADQMTDYPLSAGSLSTRIIIHFFSFYLIAFLAIYVVEQERKTRTLLVEKQSAFDRLDLLHRSIIESVDTGILTINLNGQIKSFNRAASDITGFSFSDIENLKLSEFFLQPPPLHLGYEANGKRSLTKTRFETFFMTGDERRLTLGGSVSPLRDPSGVLIGHIIVFQDLSQINEMRESLEKSRRLAFIGEMAAGLAHEIRNPLASISGSIQMLKEDFARNETNARLVQIILRAKDQLETFLKDFLLIARPAPGIRVLLDVRETMREVLESLRCIQEWPESLEINNDISDVPLLINANKIEIRQVLWNLVLNAIQSMPGGGQLKIEGRLTQAQEERGVEIKIGDTGFGIEQRDLQRIFEPFYTTRETGTGLGLAVVNRIIAAYGGKIQVQSESEKGTLFTVWIPASGSDIAADDHKEG